MKWSQQAEALDNQAAAIVRRDKQPHKLKGLFASAEELVGYSNRQYPYPYRRNSVLALAVQSGKAEVLEQILQMYFEEGNAQNDVLKLQFLSGTDSCGRFFNYHYFAADLPPEEAARADQFQSEDDEEFEMWDFKIRHGLLPKDVRTQEQRERAKMYRLIKEACVKIFSSHDWDIVKTERIFTRNADGAVYEKFSDENKAFAMLRRQPYLTEISLYDNRRNLRDEAVKLKAESEENFARQAFKTLDFPELYYWAREPLNKIQKVLLNKKLRGKNKDLEDFFITSNATLEIVRDFDASFKNSQQKDMQFKGICKFLPLENKSIVCLPAPQIMEESEAGLAELMAHEMTHNLDMVHSCATGQGNERLSDSDAVKFAFMALCMEGDNYSEEIQNIPLQLQSNYKVGAYTQELIAKVMENRDFSGCELLQNLRKLVRYFNKAKLEGDEKALNNMFWAMEEIMPDYAQMRKTYGQFVLWLRSGEQYRDMVKAGKPEEMLRLQKNKIDYRKDEFCHSYIRYCCKENQPHFDEKMAGLLKNMAQGRKTLTPQQRQLLPQEGRNY